MTSNSPDGRWLRKVLYGLLASLITADVWLSWVPTAPEKKSSPIPEPAMRTIMSPVLKAPPDLVRLAAIGDFPGARKCVARGDRVDETDQLGNTALIVAAAGGSEDIVRMLLQKGANSNLANGGGTTPLIAAATNGYEKVVRRLIVGKATLDVQDSTGSTALIYAVMRGWPKCAEMLLTAGAQTAIKDEDGKDAEAWAITNNRVDIEKMIRAKK